MTAGNNDVQFTFERPNRLVTPEILKAARSRSDIQVKDYPSFSAEIGAHAKKNMTVLPASEKLQTRKIYNNAVELIGGTPMVRLDKLAKFYGLECELLAKCEFMSVGGSVKDRIAEQMVLSAEREGKLTPGKSVIVEATSGNTGVGLCLMGAVKNYRVVIALPEKMSNEKLNTMRALGAEILRTPTEAAWNDRNSHLTLAEQLQATLPDCHFLDQYSNSANPMAHYLGTAEEILYQTDNRIDMVVVCAGTGGTISGISTKIKEVVKECITVGVDPEGSILAKPEELNKKNLGVGYQIEGIGYDFIPSTLKHDNVDLWVKTNDKNSFVVARECTRREGLLIGGSSGSALAGAIQMAKTLKKGQRCVVLLPDGARNYMTKHYSDEWMEDFGFFEPAGYSDAAFSGKCVSDIPVRPMSQEVVIDSSATFVEAMKDMKSKHCDVALLTSEGKVCGMLSRKAITNALLSGRFTKDSQCSLVMNRALRMVTPSTSIAQAARTLRLHDVVIVVDAAGALQRVLTMADITDAIAS